MKALGCSAQRGYPGSSTIPGVDCVCLRRSKREFNVMVLSYQIFSIYSSGVSSCSQLANGKFSLVGLRKQAGRAVCRDRRDALSSYADGPLGSAGTEKSGTVGGVVGISGSMRSMGTQPRV